VPGNTATANVAADPGYRIKSLKLNGKAVEFAGNPTSYTLILKDLVADQLIAAEFEPAPSDPIDISDAKAPNPLSAKGKKVTVSAAKVKKKSQGIAASKAFSVTRAQGKVSYKKASGNKKITVASSGKVTVKKGLGKGAYKIKVKVTARGNANWKAKTETVTATVKVK
jgi:hypothetical protein